MSNRSTIRALFSIAIVSLLFFSSRDLCARRICDVNVDIRLGDINLTAKWRAVISSNPNHFWMLRLTEDGVEWNDAAPNGDKVVFIDKIKVGRFLISLNGSRTPSLGYQLRGQGDDSGPDLFCRLTQDILEGDPPWNYMADIETATSRRWAILANPFPWEKEGSFVLIPVVGEHQPQDLKICDLEDVLHIWGSSENLHILFNGEGAGNSQQHMHFQLSNVSLPAESDEVASIMNVGDIIVNKLKDDPIIALTWAGEMDVSNLSDVIFRIVSEFQAREIAFNISFSKSKDKILIYPRAIEAIPQLLGKRFGTPEVGRQLIAISQEQFDAVTLDVLEITLGNALLDWPKTESILFEVFKD